MLLASDPQSTVKHGELWQQKEIGYSQLLTPLEDVLATAASPAELKSGHTCMVSSTIVCRRVTRYVIVVYDR